MSSSPSSVATVLDAAFEADDFEGLAVEVPDAELHLRPHDQSNRVQIYGSVPDADPDTARGLFDRKEISTHHSGDRLHVHGKRLSEDVAAWRWRRGRRTRVRFDIHLPPALTVDARLPGGNVDARELAGPLTLNVPGGSVHAAHIGGSLRARGSGGSLTVRDATSATLDLEWTGGPVTLEQLRQTSTRLQARAAPTFAKQLQGSTDLSVHGASLSLRSLTGPCEAAVHGGPLTYQGPLQDTLRLRCVGGSLDTQLPSDQAAALHLSGTTVGLDDGFAFEGRRTPRRIEGRLNGGGPTVHAEAIRGAARCGILEAT